MQDSFGARLRQQREERGISLATIVEQTKIKLSLLEGLERDDVSHWPHGIFRRAYIRTYAHAIGLNPDHVVRDFLEVHPDPPELIETPPAPAPRMRGLVGTFGSFALRRRTPAVEATPLQLRPDPPLRPPAPPDPPVAAAPPPPAAAVEPPPAIEAPPVEPDASVDFLAAAEVCTELARVESASQMEPLLRDLARILDAKGLIVWIWDSIASELRPALAHGYSTKVLAQLPGLRRDADNVTAAAFRSARACAIRGRDDASGALALPLLTPAGCSGVLAIELPAGASQAAPIRAAATFFAAVLAQLVPGGTDAEASAAASAQA